MHDLQPEGRRRPRAVTAPTRRHDAATLTMFSSRSHAPDLWTAAARLQREWLGYGLSTQPADRVAAERCLTAVYARLRRPRPRFAWVDSPREALPLLAGLPTLDDLYRCIRDARPGSPPLAGDVATLVSRLRGALSAGVSHGDPELSPVRRPRSRDPWPDGPPLDALAAGVPLPVVLHRGVRTALHRSLVLGFCRPVRAALAGPVPVCWYGQQDASWIAYYDVLRRLGLARYAPDDADHLEHWAALARSCGWWWPGDDTCVVVERPHRVDVEPAPGTWHGEIRPAHDGLAYRDGWRPLTST